jgi:hypothetical protein
VPQRGLSPGRRLSFGVVALLALIALGVAVAHGYRTAEVPRLPAVAAHAPATAGTR